MTRSTIDVATRYLPALLLCVGIFLVSSMPKPPIPEVLVFWNSDKLLHAAAYCLFAVLVLVGAVARAGGVTRGARIEAALFAVGYGVTDELHQSIVPGRTMSVLDLTADTIGALLGAFVVGNLVLRAWRRAAG